jgi:hypothetical protein
MTMKLDEMETFREQIWQNDEAFFGTDFVNFLHSLSSERLPSELTTRVEERFSKLFAF